MEEKVEQQLRAPRLRLELIPKPHDSYPLLYTLQAPNVLSVDQRRYRRQQYRR
jgi:hypothetical protein